MRSSKFVVVALFSLVAVPVHAGLYERLLGLEEPRIPVHEFQGALAEWERGKLTRAQVIADLGILPAEEADLDAIFAKMIPGADPIPLGGFVTLTNVGTSYDATGPAKGLGFVRVEGAGITGVEFVIRYNKIGTGTLSWQLWDDTTGAEVGVIEDTVAGDNKQGLITITPGSPLSAGLHTLRVRVKSTVATDDPVYYGASLRIRKVEEMWSVALHEVLLSGHYRTVTDLKARLRIP